MILVTLQRHIPSILTIKEYLCNTVSWTETMFICLIVHEVPANSHFLLIPIVAHIMAWERWSCSSPSFHHQVSSFERIWPSNAQVTSTSIHTWSLPHMRPAIHKSQYVSRRLYENSVDQCVRKDLVTHFQVHDGQSRGARVVHLPSDQDNWITEMNVWSRSIVQMSYQGQLCQL